MVHHLTGARALDMTEGAAALSTALGRPVRYTRPGLLRFTARLRRRGVGSDGIGFVAAVCAATGLGLNQPVTDDVRRLLGHETTSLRRFLDGSARRWRERRRT